MIGLTRAVALAAACLTVSTASAAQFMREDQVGAYKRLGVIPSLFPMHTFYWGDWHLDHTVGPDVGQNISPTCWVRKHGMIFTSHHDAPVASTRSRWPRRIFRLMPQEQRKADLMLKPDRRGKDPFARFLTASAVYRDRAALPPYLRSQGTVAYFADGPHDAVCVADALDEMIVAMLGAGNEAAQQARRADPEAPR